LGRFPQPGDHPDGLLDLIVRRSEYGLGSISGILRPSKPVRRISRLLIRNGIHVNEIRLGSAADGLFDIRPDAGTASKKPFGMKTLSFSPRQKPIQPYHSDRKITTLQLDDVFLHVSLPQAT
jgi:hypothetical protein